MNIELSEEQTRRLEEEARKLGISVSELVRIVLDEFLQPDEEFDCLVDRVLAKEEDAKRLGIPVEELVRIVVDELLQPDEEFDHLIDRVLAKNAELYWRLS